MTTKQLTISNMTAEPLNGSEAISDKTLDAVVGGLNPQPLPPRVAFSSVAFSRAIITGIILR
jgi:hypothetical protein